LSFPGFFIHVTSISILPQFPSSLYAFAMKFTFVIAILAALLVVEAAPVETNAQRMARGLPPLYPQNLKRGTPVDGK